MKQAQYSNRSYGTCVRVFVFGMFICNANILFLSKPNSTTIQPKLGLTRKLLCKPHHPTHPHKLNVPTISAVTEPIVPVTILNRLQL